jgi:hypothetical protein
MSDDMGSSMSGADATVPSAASDSGGLIDVSGMTFDELSSVIGAEDLGRALDYILASGQNGTGYHGFNSRI